MREVLIVIAEHDNSADLVYMHLLQAIRKYTSLSGYKLYPDRFTITKREYCRTVYDRLIEALPKPLSTSNVDSNLLSYTPEDGIFVGTVQSIDRYEYVYVGDFTFVTDVEFDAVVAKALHDFVDESLLCSKNWFPAPLGAAMRMTESQSKGHFICDLAWGPYSEILKTKEVSSTDDLSHLLERFYRHSIQEYLQQFITSGVTSSSQRYAFERQKSPSAEDDLIAEISLFEPHMNPTSSMNPSTVEAMLYPVHKMVRDVMPFSFWGAQFVTLNDGRVFQVISDRYRDNVKVLAYNDNATNVVETVSAISARIVECASQRFDSLDIL